MEAYEEILVKAIEENRADILSSVIHENDVKINQKISSLNQTMLELSCRKNQVDCLRILLSLGANVPKFNFPLTKKIQDCFIQQAIQYIICENIDRLKQVTTCGVDINRTDGTREENTLLHWYSYFLLLCKSSNVKVSVQMLHVLIENGADLTLVNSHGKSFLEEAKKEGRKELIKYIEDIESKKVSDVEMKVVEVEKKNGFDEISEVGKLKNDIKELKLKIKVDQKFFDYELKKKDKEIEFLEQEIAKLKFQLHSRSILSNEL
eukprot:maker-scaffold_2-snap-gene-13.43-mRNA-1 protein AED:0.04 eAED:0.04 QI:147/0.66/0.75/1/0.66/0.5/4/114/263